MYRITDIVNALFHLVGWEQHYNPSSAIDTELTQSESGLFFQGAHPLLTLDTMRAVMPADIASAYPSWDAAAAYVAGEVVNYGGKTWKSALDGNEGNIPQAGEWWTVYDPVSDFLRKVTRDGIVKAVQTFVRKKNLAGASRNILSNKTLFDGAGSLRDTIDPTGKVVGFEITPLRARGIVMGLEKIGLQMRGATGDVKVYLFHSTMPSPVATWTMQVFGTGDFAWKDFSADFAIQSEMVRWYENQGVIELPYLHSTGDGGSWYIVYSQTELPKWMRAINYARDWSRPPCMACNRGNPQVWREFSKYVRISPFMVSAPDFDTSHQLWDLSQMVYIPTTNWGINFRYSIGCDLTDFIIDQRNIFAEVVQKQVAFTALRTLATNPDVRVNRQQLNAASLLYELDGEAGKRNTGLGYELEEAYKAIELNTKGLDPVCLSCGNRGVTYGQA